MTGDLRKKQRLFKKIRNISVILSSVIIIVYIGAEPYLEAAFGNVLCFELAVFALVLASLVLVFVYESRYSKAEQFFDDEALKISDAGYYITSRDEKDCKSYVNAVNEDLAFNSFNVERNVTCGGFEFDLSARRKNEFFYCVSLDIADSNDVIAYLDCAKSDLTSQKLAVNGECVVCLVCNKVEESAITLSKNFDRIVTGRRSRLLVFPVIVELETGRVYFLGNKVSRAQKMTANYVMNCSLPFKEEYIGERLPFQSELEKRMNSKNIKDLRGN